ncbi:MAG: hypothetical protein ACAI25_11510 [Planctomycetota bacterium]
MTAFLHDAAAGDWTTILLTNCAVTCRPTRPQFLEVLSTEGAVTIRRAMVGWVTNRAETHVFRVDRDEPWPLEPAASFFQAWKPPPPAPQRRVAQVEHTVAGKTFACSRVSWLEGGSRSYAVWFSHEVKGSGIVRLEEASEEDDRYILYSYEVAGFGTKGATTWGKSSADLMLEWKLEDLDQKEKG